MLEISFGDSDIVIRRSAYGNQIAIRLHEGELSTSDVRLTLTAPTDGDGHVGRTP